MSAFRKIPTPPDLAAPVVYRRGPLGYPHICAPDRLSGIYALGCLHAIDRPIQVHLAHLAAQGRLMEFLGDDPLTRAVDRAARFFDFSGDAARQAADLRDQALEVVNAYCRGFNDTLSRRRRPLLLRALRVPPVELSPVSTILLYRLLAYFGLTSMQHSAETIVADLVASGAPRPLFDLLLGDAAAGLDLESLRGLRIPSEMSLLGAALAGGSNGFAVSGQKSATGGAILMGEFHMQTGRFPPALYAAHIEYADGDYYQGVGVPGLCFLAAGRTRYVGWTYTYGHADNVDILVERCANGTFYAGHQWRPLALRTERVRVRGSSIPEEWVHYSNGYGTVVGDVAAEGLYPFVRWAGLNETASDLNGVLDGPHPKSAVEMAERHRQAKSLALGAVIADATGKIAYVQTGRIDQRPADWTGAYPRRADDVPRQPGPLAEEARPFVLEPKEHYVVSANEFNRGRQGQWWSTLPEPIYRWERLRELLDNAERPDLATLVEASYDPVDLCARRLMSAWAPLLPDDPEVRALADWAADQSACPPEIRRAMMRLFHSLHHEAVAGALLEWLPAEVIRRLIDRVAATIFFQYHIDQALCLSRPELLDAARLRMVLARAWPAARARAASPDCGLPARFAFVNDYFRGKLPRPLGFDSPVVEPPGGPTLVFQARDISFAGIRLYFAPAFHMVFDMSRSGAWFHLPGGASERRFGPGYGRGVQEWLTGRFFPLGSADGPPPDLAATFFDHRGNASKGPQ